MNKDKDGVLCCGAGEERQTNRSSPRGGEELGTETVTVPRGDARQGLGEQVCILGERLELEISLEKMAFKALGLDRQPREKAQVKERAGGRWGGFGIDGSGRPGAGRGVWEVVARVGEGSKGARLEAATGGWQAGKQDP